MGLADGDDLNGEKTPCRSRGLGVALLVANRRFRLVRAHGPRCSTRWCHLSLNSRCQFVLFDAKARSALTTYPPDAARQQCNDERATSLQGRRRRFVFVIKRPRETAFLWHQHYACQRVVFVARCNGQWFVARRYHRLSRLQWRVHVGTAPRRCSAAHEPS